MTRKRLRYVAPELVLDAVYRKTSVQLKMSEKRRDEVIAASIFTAFRNQEFGTRFQLPSDYKKAVLSQDAEGIDLIVANERGRRKELQIKGVYLQRSIERRRLHKTRGYARVTSHKAQRLIKRDSEELTRIMRGELEKIIQDYSGLILIIHVIADLANQTSLEIAIHNNSDLIDQMRAKEVWFLRNIPVRAIHGKESPINTHSYKLIKAVPDQHTYVFTFAF